tara:strand:+ start:12470 stop:12790 length:321 start_codon:yes stop_codon:yes gene_type:complete
MIDNRKKNKSVISILKGDFIIGETIATYTPFLLMLFVLALISISSSFHSEKLLEKSIKLEKEVEHLSRIHTAHKLDLMKIYKRSIVEEFVKSQGIKTSKIPPVIIE